MAYSPNAHASDMYRKWKQRLVTLIVRIILDRYLQLSPTNVRLVQWCYQKMWVFVEHWTFGTSFDRTSDDSVQQYSTAAATYMYLLGYGKVSTLRYSTLR